MTVLWWILMDTCQRNHACWSFTFPVLRTQKLILSTVGEDYLKLSKVLVAPIGIITQMIAHGSRSKHSSCTGSACEAVLDNSFWWEGFHQTGWFLLFFFAWTDVYDTRMDEYISLNKKWTVSTLVGPTLHCQLLFSPAPENWKMSSPSNFYLYVYFT